MILVVFLSCIDITFKNFFLKKVYFPQGRAIGKIKLFSTYCFLKTRVYKDIFSTKTKNKKKYK